MNNGGLLTVHSIMLHRPLACLFVLSLGGCASIVGGTMQSVSVSTAGPVGSNGAKCTLANDKGEWFVTTPGSVTVHRSYSDLLVNCSHETAGTGTFAGKSSTKGMAFGNILFGGFIGAGVDMQTGAAYDYPNLIVVQMHTASEAAVPGTTTPSSQAPASDGSVPPTPGATTTGSDTPPPTLPDTAPAAPSAATPGSATPIPAAPNPAVPAPVPGAPATPASASAAAASAANAPATAPPVALSPAS